MSLKTTTLVTYYSLPSCIWYYILKILLKDGVSCAAFAAVSREWQAIIERHNFERLKVTPQRLSTFQEMTHRNQHLVRYIWLCLEISEYPPVASWGVVNEDNTLIAEAIESLFSSLSTWQLLGDLTLDISVYSPSDVRNPLLRYLTFEPDLNPKDCPYDQNIHGDAPGIPYQSRIDKFALMILFDDLLSRNGYETRELDDVVYWLSGQAETDPDFPGGPHILSDDESFERMLTELEQSTPAHDGLVNCWEQMPSVPAVTRMLLRQQTRRSWPPEQLRKLFLRLPELQEIHYEPWRNWLGQGGGDFDDNLRRLLPEACLKTLKRLILFENFNETYPEMMHCLRLREPSPNLSAALAETNLSLEPLSAAFSVDASYFFNGCHSSWKWSNLTLLAVTSQLLRPDADPHQLEEMLQEAAAVALRMPQLQTLEIWEGRKGLAALFKYQSRPARLAWKATWYFRMPDSVTRAWDEVGMMFYGLDCAVVKQLLDGAAIKSHADSIVQLRLSQTIVRPVSLQQIRREQRYLDP
ncbi:unnamed protein product [Clonostachys chloroleuca]|uniref:DUF6546 domain-containing protein n=1 Tax=Clonostachys chloroleuca TaxID=1926264 RepID=A0AA35Q5M7_9HYPO|nr:unnamed protein product [Clonostachys chloroleuca]